MADDFLEVEKALSDAAAELSEDTSEPDIEALRRRAHRQLTMRDSVNLGFAFLVTTLLKVFSGIYRNSIR